MKDDIFDENAHQVATNVTPRYNLALVALVPAIFLTDNSLQAFTAVNLYQNQIVCCHQAEKVSHVVCSKFCAGVLQALPSQDLPNLVVLSFV